MHMQESSQQLEAILGHNRAVVLASDLRWYCKLLKASVAGLSSKPSHPDIQWLPHLCYRLLSQLPTLQISQAP